VLEMLGSGPAEDKDVIDIYHGTVVTPVQYE